MADDSKQLLEIHITRERDYDFSLLVKNPLTGKTEPISDSTDIRFLFKDDEDQLDAAVTTIARLLHTTGAGAGEYLDTGGETITFTLATRIINRSAGDWAADGFLVGQRFQVTGSGSNDAILEILTVTATDITCIVGTALVDEAILGALLTSILAPKLLTADLDCGLVNVTGPPDDLAGKQLGSLSGSCVLIRGVGTTQQAPRRSAVIRLEG